MSKQVIEEGCEGRRERGSKQMKGGLNDGGWD